jgi:hypothetical protein
MWRLRDQYALGTTGSRLVCGSPVDPRRTLGGAASEFDGEHTWPIAADCYAPVESIFREQHDRDSPASFSPLRSENYLVTDAEPISTAEGYCLDGKSCAP